MRQEPAHLVEVRPPFRCGEDHGNVPTTAGLAVVLTSALEFFIGDAAASSHIGSHSLLTDCVSFLPRPPPCLSSGRRPHSRTASRARSRPGYRQYSNDGTTRARGRLMGTVKALAEARSPWLHVGMAVTAGVRRGAVAGASASDPCYSSAASVASSFPASSRAPSSSPSLRVCPRGSGAISDLTRASSFLAAVAARPRARLPAGATARSSR